MTTTLWIVVAVVAALLLIAVGAGLVLRRRRRISLREAEQVEPGSGTPPPPARRGGTYQASGGFDFSAGSGSSAPTARPPRPGAPTPPSPTPSDGSPSTLAPSPVAPSPAPDGGLAPSTRPADSTARKTPDSTLGRTVDGAPDGTGGTVVDSTAATTVDSAARTAPLPPAPGSPLTAPTDPGLRPVDPADVDPAAATVPPPASTAPAPTAPVVSAPTASAPTSPAPTAPVASAPTVVSPTPIAPPEEIAPAEGRLERLRGRLSRSRSGFGQGLLGLLGAGDLDEESWEDVEATLLQADLGPEMTVELTETLRTELARRAARTPEQVRALLHDVLTAALHTERDRSVRALAHDGRPGVLLVVGVNGTGKTTTTGKLARVLVAGGRTVVLGAADTFRAAAAEQLTTWGERAGATVVRGAEGADPASVAFDAVARGTAEGADVVLLDTAGRLHTKTGLMDELGKVKRVVERQSQVDEVLLVLDATTGQNGLVQAKVFADVVDITGIALTKLDGTAKGGIVFRVQRELGVPVKLVGLGEGPDDLAPFEPAAFVDALLR